MWCRGGATKLARPGSGRKPYTGRGRGCSGRPSRMRALRQPEAGPLPEPRCSSAQQAWLPSLFWISCPHGKISVETGHPPRNCHRKRAAPAISCSEAKTVPLVAPPALSGCCAVLAFGCPGCLTYVDDCRRRKAMRGRALICLPDIPTLVR